MKQETGKWCLILIEIEHFIVFCEMCGKENADLLIEEYFEILKSPRWGKSVVSHMSIDSFLLFVKYDELKIDQLASELTKAKDRFAIATELVPSMGVYELCDGEAVSFKAYVSAIYAKKQATPSYESSMVHKLTTTTKKIDKELFDAFGNALKNGEIYFCLQPQCRIPSGDIVEAEVLARWTRPDGTSIPPSEFVPMLEKGGMVSKLDRFIWEEVCKWLASLKTKGLKPVRVSVNVSYYDIMVMDVCDVLEDLCQKYDIPTELIGVEITETVFSKNFDRVEKLITKLKSKGFLTLMDDFGSGYSSLNMLDNVSVDIIKLDMAFMKKGGVSSKRNVTIIETIINMAKMLGQPIVIEGVESAQQEKFLTDTGCRYAQGYYYYEPMSVTDFEKLLYDNTMDCDGFVCKPNEQMHVNEFLAHNSFTDTMLNNILGPVAFFELDGDNLSITRYNSLFFDVFSDINLDEHKDCVQNYIDRRDLPNLYKSLENAQMALPTGGLCDVRVNKTLTGEFWYRIRFFFLKNDGAKKIFYAKLEDITESRHCTFRHLEMLRGDAEVAMVVDIGQRKLWYVPKNDPLTQTGIDKIDLETGIRRTVDTRIEDEDDKRKFVEFFDVKRLKYIYDNAIFDESLCINFRLGKDKESKPVRLDVYYTKWNHNQDLFAYIFVHRCKGEHQQAQSKPN